jgi:hypothetical protein
LTWLWRWNVPPGYGCGRFHNKGIDVHTLLLGNGINRLSAQLDWFAVLKALADSVPGAEHVQHFEQKPLSMYFEELCSVLAGSQPFRAAEIAVKRRIAGLLKQLPPEPLLKDLVDLFSVILTTNYDHAIEMAVAGPLYHRQYLLSESRYSLFRRSIAGTKVVWHIHGDINYPETILLGYDHYAGYLQKIRNYQTGPMTQQQLNCLMANSASISRGDPACVNLFSWVDHFLRDHLHIVGLGLDFTEMDLWWLLVYKRRKNKVTGHTFYYHIQLPGSISQQAHPQISLLGSLDVRVETVRAATYREGYEKVLEKVRINIGGHPGLLSDVRNSSHEEYLPGGIDSQPVRRRTNPQLSLKFPKAKRRN